jgi:hypothetical protein
VGDKCDVVCYRLVVEDPVLLIASVIETTVESLEWKRRLRSESLYVVSVGRVCPCRSCRWNGKHRWLDYLRRCQRNQHGLNYVLCLFLIYSRPTSNTTCHSVPKHTHAALANKLPSKLLCTSIIDSKGQRKEDNCVAFSKEVCILFDAKD